MRGMVFFVVVLAIADAVALDGQMRTELQVTVSRVTSTLAKELRIFSFAR